MDHPAIPLGILTILALRVAKNYTKGYTDTQVSVPLLGQLRGVSGLSVTIADKGPGGDVERSMGSFRHPDERDRTIDIQSVSGGSRKQRLGG